MTDEDAADALRLDVDRVFAALAAERDLSADDLGAFSHLDAASRERALAALLELDEQGRFALLERLIALAQERIEFDFSAICLACLDDPAPALRSMACTGLDEYQGRDALKKLLDLAEHDEDAGVRAEAVTALAPFAERAVFEQLRPADSALVEAALRGVAESAAEEPAVRAAAIVSAGVFTTDWVRDLIHDLLAADDPAQRLASLQAIARSADEYWVPTVIDAMTSEDEETRVSAALAAGALAEEDAVPGLEELLDDTDLEVVQAAVAALAEIGGPEAGEILQRYRTHPDAEIRGAVQAALDAIAAIGDPIGFPVRGG